MIRSQMNFQTSGCSTQTRRKKIEEPFGWAKTVRPIAQAMLQGVRRVGRGEDVGRVGRDEGAVANRRKRGRRVAS